MMGLGLVPGLGLGQEQETQGPADTGTGRAVGPHSSNQVSWCPQGLCAVSMYCVHLVQQFRAMY